MNTRERFEKVRREQQNRFSLRTRLTVFVTIEMIVCVLVAYCLDRLLNNVLSLGWKIPLEVELLCTCLLIGLLFTSQLSKYFFNPIKKLRRAIDQVAEGDFSVRLEEKSSSKEIMEIYTGFNLMAHELSSTEILQTDFVSNVSHEFRAPLSAIQGYVTLLSNKSLSEEKRTEYFDKLVESTKQISGLIDNVLRLSKLKSQNIVSEKKIFSLDEQLRRNVLLFEEVWQRKNIAFLKKSVQPS